jgi:hypothetical protein
LRKLKNRSRGPIEFTPLEIPAGFNAPLKFLTE